MALEPGRELLHYRLTEKIGEGGMGVVWRARDTSLERDVAIKVLPEVAADADRLARFEREARLLAQLEHPNIASIYGLHESPSTGSEQAGVRFLAMELVEGEDLAERLKRGPMTVDEAVAVTRQVADALEHAHAGGVIHRDLKPANVMLTPDGKAKVLDFGLAKAFEADSASGVANPSLSPTVTSAGTVAGVLLGTAAYMSPEQARAQQADRRSDIWALGCMLYEMLTPGQLFRGQTISDTLAEVLKSDPDWNALPADLPLGVRRVLRLCLEKNPDRRLHDAADVRILIEQAMTARPEVDATAALETPRSRPWLAPVLVLLALSVGVAVGWFLEGEPEPLPVRHYLIQPAETGEAIDGFEISPDGRRLAHVADGTLFIRNLDRIESRPVEGITEPSDPFWSPDSAWLAFFADDKLWKVPAEGGAPTPICDAENVEGGFWRSDGDIVVVVDRRTVKRVPSRGGDLETIYEPDRNVVRDFHGFAELPDGRLLVAVHGPGIRETSLELWAGEERTTLMKYDDGGFGGIRWSDTGHVVYGRYQTNVGIWAVPFSLSASEITGEPFLVVPQGSDPSISRDGTLVYQPADSGEGFQLVWVTADGEVGPTIGQKQRRMFSPALSPDGTRVAVSGYENNGWDIWIHDVARGNKTRLTFMDEAEADPTWTPDGTSLLFTYPFFGGDRHVYRVPTDGSGDPERIIDGSLSDLATRGDQLILRRRTEETQGDLWTMPLDGSSEPRLFLGTAAAEWGARLSPDGSVLAYVSDETGRAEVYLKTFPEGDGKWQVSIDGGRNAEWSPEGGELFFVDDGVLYRLDVDTDGGIRLSTPRKVLDGDDHQIELGRGYMVVPESSPGKFIMIQRVVPEEGAMKDGIYLVENWMREFAE